MKYIFALLIAAFCFSAASAQDAPIRIDASWDIATDALTFTVVNASHSTVDEIASTIVSGKGVHGVHDTTPMNRDVDAHVKPVASLPSGFSLLAGESKTLPVINAKRDASVKSGTTYRYECINVGFRDASGADGHAYACMCTSRRHAGNYYQCFAESFDKQVSP